jgi:TP901 family phage tail tape measure protein
MADENYAIRVSFDGIDKAISDIKTLQSAIGNIKAPVLNLGGADASNIAVAALKKLQLEIDALEKKKAQSGANDATRSAAFISQLERQKAASAVRVSDGADKEAARVAQELLRYKQQLAAIDAKLINPADIANAKALASEINKLNLDKIKKGFDDASPVTFNQFIGATTEKARDLAEQLQNTSQTLERIGTTFNQVSSAANQAFLGFDTAKTKIATLSNESDAFAGVAIKLSGELKNQVTSAEILGAQYEILSSGFSNVADASEITRVSVLGAKAGFTDTATVADATTSVLNAYGLAANDAALIVDKFAVVQDKGKTTIGQFAGQLGKIAPIAKAAGVSFDEVSAAIATTTATGIKTESAVSGVRQAIVTLLKPTAAAAKELEKYGIANSAAILKTEGLSGVLKRLSASGATSSEQLSKIFTDVDGLAAVLPLISGDLGKFNENLAAIGNASGKAQAGFDIVAKSAQGQITAAINKINEALVNLGRGTQTAFAPLIAVVGAAVDVFNQLPAPIQVGLGAIIGLAGGIATLGAALTAIGAAAPAFVGGLKLFGGAAGIAAFGANALTFATTLASNAFTLLTTKAGLAAIAQGALAVGTGVLTGALTAASVAAYALTTPLGLIVVAAIPLIAVGKQLSSAFNVSESTKSLEDYKQKLAELQALRGKLASPEQTTDDGLGRQGATFDIFGAQRGRQKEVIAFAENQKEYTKALDESLNVLNKYGVAIDATGAKNRLGAEGVAKFNKETKEQVENIDLAINSLKAQAQGASDNPALQKLLNNEIAIFSKRKKLLEDRIAAVNSTAAKEASAIAEVTDEQRKQAERIREAQNQDAEKSIKRSFEDTKAKRDRENADAIKAIEEKNALAKGELDRKQALETEVLKEKQTLALQDKQRAFDDTQNAKKLQLEDALDAKKRANEEKLNKLKQDFDDKQNALKEQRADKQRKDDEAFAAQRAQRDKQASEALSKAKQLISNEGAIATVKPEDRARIAAQIEEEERIRSQAATQGQGGVQSQEQLVAQAKQIAQVSAIATGEEQKKVQLALDELEKANKAKQAEIDKAEDVKRTEVKRASDKAFEAELNAAKLAFDAEQNAAKLAFENTVLKPEKQRIEAELQASKLAFERGELAAIKEQQADEERALKLQQTNEDLALRKAADAELETIKLAQKEKELALDRAFEDQKIERERVFKEQQRALDKASAIEIQQILGKSAQQIIDALAVTKGGTSLSAATGAGASKVPAFASGVINFRGGMALVGERGAELVTLPRGSNVLPANQTKNVLNNSGGNKTYNVNVTTGSGNATEIALQIQREMARSAALSM